MLILVTGGARSGKSAWALARANDLGGRRRYIATAEAGDDEMRERIARHRAERGSAWETIEAPQDPAAALRDADTIVLDCLTLWTSNLVLAGRDDAAIEHAAAALARAAAVSPATVIAVTNEVGWGIVPEHPLARRFRDVAGRVNQQVAAAAAEVWLLVAGAPLRVR